MSLHMPHRVEKMAVSTGDFRLACLRMRAEKPVGIIGLGYVGLPLSLHFAENGVPVIGFDIDSTKVEKLGRGESYIMHIPPSRVREAAQKGSFNVTTDFTRVNECQALILCLPTPLGENRDPDLSYVLETARVIAPHLQREMLVVLESTTYPGTTDTELREILEAGSKLRAGVDFFLGYSPERENPGNSEFQLADIPKVVGGYTPACLTRVKELYSRVIKRVIPVSSCRVAEAVKLTENIFRAVNIAMVNELKSVYGAMGIDIWEVIEAARTKPFGFMPFYPGPGLGGHCIPIDPFYLTWKARQFGEQTRFIELAGEVNTAMPAKVVQTVIQALRSQNKAIPDSRVLLLGIAYKSNVDDDRESPSYVLWQMLEERGAIVSYHDPHVPVIRPSREHSQFAGKRSIELTPTTIAEFDLVLIVTRHDAVDYEAIAQHAQLIVDTRNALPQLKGGAKYFRA